VWPRRRIGSVVKAEAVAAGEGTGVAADMQEVCVSVAVFFPYLTYGWHRWVNLYYDENVF
jgi:hypothetical protein